MGIPGEFVWCILDGHSVTVPNTMYFDRILPDRKRLRTPISPIMSISVPRGLYEENFEEMIIDFFSVLIPVEGKNLLSSSLCDSRPIYPQGENGVYIWIFPHEEKDKVPIVARVRKVEDHQGTIARLDLFSLTPLSVGDTISR